MSVEAETPPGCSVLESDCDGLDFMAVADAVRVCFAGKLMFRVAGKRVDVGSAVNGIEADRRRFSSRKPKTSAAGRVSGLVGC